MPSTYEKYKLYRRTPKGRAYRLRAAMARIKRHKEWIDAYKVTKGCEQCGFDEWPEALDFDHQNPKTKTFSISQKLMWSLKVLQREIKKCRILCANCHRHHSKETHWRKA